MSLAKQAIILVKFSQHKTSTGPNWGVSHFEDIANGLDINDEKYTGDAGSSSNQLRKLSRPCLASAGIENFICCMNPLKSPSFCMDLPIIKHFSVVANTLTKECTMHIHDLLYINCLQLCGCGE